MSDLEHLIEEALRPIGSGPPPPSRDLFARVLDSVADDRARRRRARRTVALWVAAVALVATLVLTLTPQSNGDLLMPWWILELATNLVLVATAVWLGPFIKRFGRAYAADVFHDNPMTGKSYIVLTDIVYYLIFTAYICFTVTFAPTPEWDNDISALVTPQQLQSEVFRIGGILLVIGILHGLNIVLMPVLGRLFSLNRRVTNTHGTAPGPPA
ncbi:hypothetical protein [Terrabacter sp. Soil810]|uniref:hypothetical protein n=1 Tax=Terrabacter sp. Soil810 TaxID=1736418 RepID=UPI00070E0639|nr:hypothetical protein [Terrabacter sp. Soil810]KRF46142.1 hypothetical protein ASG96_21180 [Terrabacter sp. Soil810]